MRSAQPLLLLLALLALSATLTACGGGGYVGGGYGGGGYAGGGGGGGGGLPPDPAPVLLTGTVAAGNDTFTDPATFMFDFALWTSGAARSNTNLLPYELLPGEALEVAEVDEDFYDADAFMSDGLIDYLEVWSDVYVPAGDVTTFFAF